MRTLTYKFLNTIVDDFFSFVISMPLLHRLACFRDDVVFVSDCPRSIMLWTLTESNAITSQVVLLYQ